MIGSSDRRDMGGLPHERTNALMIDEPIVQFMSKGCIAGRGSSSRGRRLDACRESQLVHRLPGWHPHRRSHDTLGRFHRGDYTGRGRSLGRGARCRTCRPSALPRKARRARPGRVVERFLAGTRSQGITPRDTSEFSLACADPVYRACSAPRSDARIDHRCTVNDDRRATGSGLARLRRPGRTSGLG